MIEKVVRDTIGKLQTFTVSDIATHTVVRYIDGVDDPKFISDIRKNIDKPSVHITLATSISNVS